MIKMDKEDIAIENFYGLTIAELDSILAGESNYEYDEETRADILRQAEDFFRFHLGET